ncbi:MAG: hypothetical protein R6V83_14515 [Candidatus Thorarchaeota archaeon]
MEFGLAVNIRESIEEIREIIQASKGSNINQIWVTDYPATRYAPIVAAALAKETQSMRFGMGLLSPLLHPLDQIKRTIQSLISRYGERFDILIGPGDRFALANVGVDYGEIDTLVNRLVDDAIELKSYVSEEGFDCRVFMAAQGPKMIAESMKTDGVILNYSSMEHIKWALNRLDNVSSEFIVSVFPPTHITQNNECEFSYEVKRAAAMVILGLSQSAIKELSIDESLSDAKQLHRDKGYIDREVLEAISQESLQKFSLCTTEVGVQEYLKQIESIGTDMVVFGPPVGKEKSNVKQLLCALNEMKP